MKINRRLSIGININLVWSIVLLGFGMVMLVLSRRSAGNKDG